MAARVDEGAAINDDVMETTGDGAPPADLATPPFIDLTSLGEVGENQLTPHPAEDPLANIVTGEDCVAVLEMWGWIEPESGNPTQACSSTVHAPPNPGPGLGET